MPSLAGAIRPDAPGECHPIALELARRGIPVCHIYEEEAIDAVELGRAIDQEDSYEHWDLADVLRWPPSRLSRFP